MLLLIVILALIFLAAAVVGFVVKGLFWIGVLAVILLIIMGIIGYFNRVRARRRGPGA